jgi:hypothetical protein
VAGNIQVTSNGSSGTTIFRSNETTNRTITLPDVTGTVMLQGAVAGALVASPTGVTNTSGLMLGLSNLSATNIITPLVTGRVSISISGVVAQSATADGAIWHIRTGTGTAPSNGGALTGTQSGGQQSMTYLTGVLKVPFSIESYVTGAAVGTPLWIDLVLGSVTAGTATMTQVMTTAFEF